MPPVRQYDCTTCRQPIPVGHVFVYESEPYRAIHAPRGSQRWNDQTGEVLGPAPTPATRQPAPQQVAPSGGGHRVELVGVDIPLDQVFRLVWKVMFSVALLSFVAGIIFLACRDLLSV
jgi:hypothetical protein